MYFKDIEENLRKQNVMKPTKMLHDNNVARQNNTIEIQVSSSYKTSEFDITKLPDRVFNLCENLELLELNYVIPYQLSEGS